MNMMMNRKLASILFCVLGLLMTTCGHENILAPGGATMVLSANPLSIPADGASTAEISAIVQDSSGQALNGTTVYFTTTLGTITDKAKVENGIANAVLTAGEDEGTATVRAVSGVLSDSIQIIIGFQNVSIFLTANPPEIRADGIDSSRIEAFVTEQKGLIPDGTDVFFTTTLGTITSSAKTHSGLAVAMLTSGVVEGDATVTAIVRNTSQPITVSVGIPVSNITLSINPSTFEVDTAEAQTHVASIIATVWNAAGIPIVNKPVVISSDKGQLDSGGSVQKTNANGQVTDTFRITIAVPQGTSQSVRITATSGSISVVGTVTIINKGG
jgi:hypothetical protein